MIVLPSLTSITSIEQSLRHALIGQDEAIGVVMPFLEIFTVGLSPKDRPIANILMLGPTGTGKTYMVERLASVLHGSESKVLKINCAEYHSDHETARLVGAPPGYLGHRDTHAVLSQSKLNGATTSGCSISLILFDEIEKASFKFHRYLLGIMDKGDLCLGDGSHVSFANSIVFMTSNLGAREIDSRMENRFGLVPTQGGNVVSGVDRAVRRKFDPEFLNRLDATVMFRPLSEASINKILTLELTKIRVRLSGVGVDLAVKPSARKALMREGFSPRHGAREMKRVLNRRVTMPIAHRLARREFIPPAIVEMRWTKRQGPVFVCRPWTRAMAA